MVSAHAPDKSTITMPDILGLTTQKMQEFFESINEKPFRATQLIKWFHQQQIVDFDQMLNLSKQLRNKLQQNVDIRLPTIIKDKVANDGTRKWLLQLADDNSVETVYIPTETRATLCISSQVGCSLNCSFCYTAQQGYNRNLTAAEIISQLWIANQQLIADGKPKITNVVIMGMGEPLLNFKPIVDALRLMFDDNAYGLSKRKVTLSTSGVVPMMYQLKKEIEVSLAVSLHAPNDELRNKLVPINKKYPLKELIEACKNYTTNKYKSHITFEYIMLKDINDSIKHAKQLINLIQGVQNKVNLIPFNHFPASNYDCSSPETISNFQQKLMSAGINTIVRRTRGENIGAACGQLAGEITDRTKRSAKHQIVTVNALN